MRHAGQPDIVTANKNSGGGGVGAAAGALGGLFGGFGRAIGGIAGDMFLAAALDAALADLRYEEAEALAYRLGNMTLMQAGVNRDLGNAAYAAKRAA